MTVLLGRFLAAQGMKLLRHFGEFGVGRLNNGHDVVIANGQQVPQSDIWRLLERSTSQGACVDLDQTEQTKSLYGDQSRD